MIKLKVRQFFNNCVFRTGSILHGWLTRQMPEVELMNFDQNISYLLGRCMLKSNFETFPKEAAKWRKGLGFWMEPK